MREEIEEMEEPAATPPWQHKILDHCRIWLEELQEEPVLAEAEEQPDLYSFYEQLCVLRSEFRKNSRRSQETFLQFGEHLGEFKGVMTSLAQRLDNASVPPDAPVVSLDEFRKQPAAQQIVVLPAGSTIPVKVEVSGDVFRASNGSVLPLVLNVPIEIVMNNGLPTGKWRFPGDSWEMARETHWISIPWIKAELAPQSGPEIRTSLVVEARHQPTH